MFVDTSNAVISKARAKYGNRLTEKDYNALLRCVNVSAVVSYLTSHTKYRDVLGNINETSVHRGQLETLLKQKNFYDFDSLCRYEFSKGSPFSEFIIRRYEQEQLMHFLLLLNCNKQQQYLFSLPSYFDKHTEIDLYRLSKCNDFDSFINALGNSVYKDILSPFRPKQNEPIDLACAEDALNIYSTKELYSAISKQKSKKQKSKLKELCDHVNDFCNISRILRLKKYYDLDKDTIKQHLLPFGTIRQDMIDMMAQAKSVDEVFSILSTTRVFKKIKDISIEKEEQMSFVSRYRECKHNMYYSTDPAVVLLSYMYISEIELKNIITIIEGVRYNSDKEQIKALLIQ